MRLASELLLDARDDEWVAIELGDDLVVCLWDENDNDLRKPRDGFVTDLCFWAGHRDDRPDGTWKPGVPMAPDARRPVPVQTRLAI